MSKQELPLTAESVRDQCKTTQDMYRLAELYLHGSKRRQFDEAYEADREECSKTHDRAMVKRDKELYSAQCRADEEYQAHRKKYDAIFRAIDEECERAIEPVTERRRQTLENVLIRLLGLNGKEGDDANRD